MSPRAPALVILTLLAPGACSRRPGATPPAVRASSASSAVASRARAEREGPRHARGEPGAEEVMERARDLSPYAPNEQGLAQLVRDVVEAAGRGDRVRLEAIVGPVVPTREVVRLGLTFEGDRVLGPYLTAPSALTTEQLVARALRWAGLTEVSVSAATGEQIAQGGAAAAGLDPAMARIGSLLRPLVRFYRVTLAEPGTSRREVLESFAFLGGRWQYVPEPWRFAPGEPTRGATAPTQPWASSVRQMPPGR